MMERRYLNAVEGKKDGVYQDRNLMVGSKLPIRSHIIKCIESDLDLDKKKVPSYSMAVHAGGHNS